MPILDVSGVQVNFPFEPYPCQVDYMGKVIESLQKNVNAVLESPTGTGKTLCLLCSSLAWQESKKAQTEFNKQVSVSNLLGGDTKAVSEKGLQSLAKSLETSTGMAWGGSDFAVPRIIYASRTHSQLSQVIQELKRTAYNSVKVSVIGSRDQLCIHEQVKKEQNNTNKVHMCRAKVQNRTCYYYNHYDDLKKNSETRTLMSNVVDIEDLVGYGQKNKVCPYYMARDLKSDADITFMPYNYLLDPKTRKHHGVELQGSVIIFDEAHNLEQICEDNSSFDLKPGDLATAIEELTKMAEKMVALATSEESAGLDTESDGLVPDFTLDELLRLKSTLKDLEDQIDAIEVPNNDKGLTKPGMFMFELLAKANIVFDNKGIIVELMDRLVSFITTDPSGAGTGITKGAGLSKVGDVLKIIFSQELVPGHSLVDHQTKLSRSYKVHVHKEEPVKKKKTVDLWATASSASTDKSGKVLSYWCFSPGHSMNDLVAHGVKCIILTSGTLSPLTSFTSEMQIPFPVTLENPHVIQKHQVMVGTLPKGPDGAKLNSNFKTRSTPAYQGSLGNCIVNFARVVPNGLLIFFPSYPVMEKCLEMWKENNIWNRIEQYKQIFVEPRSKGVLNDLMNDFYDKINDQTLNGAIFIAVCRGKVSEGLDFSDNNGRAVVITGLPYPPYYDPKVVLKMQYLDEMKGKQGYQTLSGNEWYKQQASRAVNQAIGRVIRHREDFGAILLCDERFAAEPAVRQLPVWVRPHVKKYTAFGQSLRDTMLFFKNAERMMPSPRPSKHKGSGASAGAYFMPTATRTGNTAGSHAQPAHMVAQHVPSLKHKEEAMSVDKLTEHYRWTVPTVNSNSASQKSLFSALDHTESTHNAGLPDTQIPSYQPSPTSREAVRKPQAKKKIVIKKRSSDEVCSSSQPDQCTEVSSKVSITHVNSAEDYIAEVKSTLKKEDYNRFSAALKEYNKSNDIDKVCAVLADLFTDHEQNHHLLAKFYRFVRAKHKIRFHEVCLELTGIPVYKPQDSVNKKRLQDNSTKPQEIPEKKQKLEASGKFCDKSNNAQNTVLKSHCDNNSGVSTNSCLDAQTHLKGLNSVAKIVGDNISAKGHTDSVTIGAKPVDIINIQTDINVSEVGSIDAGNSASNLQKTCIGHPGKKSGFTCGLCNKDAKIPFKSLCEHICCMSCWRQVFEGTKQCPVCNQRVRRRHLARQFFRESTDTDDQSLGMADKS